MARDLEGSTRLWFLLGGGAGRLALAAGSLTQDPRLVRQSLLDEQVAAATTAQSIVGKLVAAFRTGDHSIGRLGSRTSLALTYVGQALCTDGCEPFGLGSEGFSRRLGDRSRQS